MLLVVDFDAHCSLRYKWHFNRWLINRLLLLKVNCDLSHRRSVAVLCMLYKIRCNPMHPFCGALPVPYVPVRVTRGALIAHRYTLAPPRCRTTQYRKTFILLSVSLWNDLVDPVLDGVGLAGIGEQVQCLFVGLVALSFFVFNYVPFLFFSSIGW